MDHSPEELDLGQLRDAVAEHLADAAGSGDVESDGVSDHQVESLAAAHDLLAAALERLEP